MLLLVITKIKVFSYLSELRVAGQSSDGTSKEHIAKIFQVDSNKHFIPECAGSLH